MKGNYSSRESIAMEWSNRSLFPDTPYGVDSGGEPNIIPTLSYREFLEFHKRYYHPSNCKIFLYGNILPEKILEFLDKHFLCEFNMMEIDSAIPMQKSWDKAVNLCVSWPSSENENSLNKTIISLNWKLFGHEDPVKILSMDILAEMLMGNPGAPLYKSLLESGLGEDLSPGSGVDFNLNEGTFSVAIRGSNPGSSKDFEKLVFKILKNLVKTGFDKDLTEGSMRLAEFRAREIKGGGPFGLRLLRKIMKAWNYDMPPGESIRFARHMEILREKASRPGYFESLLEKWIINNPHYSLVTVIPDSSKKKKEEKELQKELNALANAMGKKEWIILEEKNKALRKFQERKDAMKLPSLATEDIPSKVKVLDVVQEDCQGTLLLTQKVYSNGILYHDMAFSLKDLDEDIFCFLPLFCLSLGSIGLPGIPHDKLSREIAMKTGGFNAFAEVSHKISDHPGTRPESFLYIRIKMLESMCQEALKLSSSLLLNADFDNLPRLEQNLMELWNDLKGSLIPGGHSYVMNRNSSRFSRSARKEDLMYGIGQLQFLEDLQSRKGYLEKLPLLMKELRNKVFCRENMTLSLVMDKEFMDHQKRKILEFWYNTLPGGSQSRNSRYFSSLFKDILPPDPPDLGEAEGLEVPSSVGFVGKTIRASAMEDDSYISESLLSQLLKTGPLWEKIRMKGGAYGAFCSHSGLDRIFSFTSYRDPEILKSLEAFRESMEEFLDFNDSEKLEKAIIAIAGNGMKPQSPSEKCLVALKRRLYGIEDALRQRHRDLLLCSKPEDIPEITRILLDRWSQDSITVMAHPDRLEEASAVLTGLNKNRLHLPQ